MQQQRSSLQIQMDVMFAILLRDMYRKYTVYKLGTVWVVLEPILAVAVFMVIFGARGRGEFGFVEPPIFILASMLPYRVLFMNGQKAMMGARRTLKSFHIFRQISLVDVFMAKILLEFFMALLVIVVICGGLYWLFDINGIPQNVPMLLYYLLLITLFGAGFGVFFGVLSSYAKEIEQIVDLMSLPIMFLSAIMYPMSTVPEPIRTYLAYNPLVHLMEGIREAWFQVYTSPVLDHYYVFWWTVGINAVGMLLYRRAGEKGLD